MKTIFDVGMSIERKGINFYINALKFAEDVNSKNLLQYLACEEEKHLAYFQKLKEETKQDKKIDVKPQHTKFMFNKKAYKNIEEASSKLIKVFETAIKMEEQSIKLYTEAAQKQKNPEIKKILLQIAEYESEHKQLIKAHSETLYNYLYWEGIEPTPIES
jgi:rubrerythrin